jgi:hypothetical protein
VEERQQGEREEPVAAPVEPDEDEARSWRDRLHLGGWTQLLLLTLGLAALVLGGLNAWRSEASTTLLIIGTVLAIAAVVFARDWRELELRYGDWQARLVRGVDHVLEQAEQKSPSEPVRRQIAEIRAQVEELAERSVAPEARRVPLRSLTAAPSAGFFLSKPQASHRFNDSSSATLTLHVPAKEGKSPYTCVVVTPRDERFEATVPPSPLNPSWGPPASYSIWFPDQYLASGPLEPGLHLVEWRKGSAGGQQRPGGRPIVEALASLSLPIVARDSFMVPERRPPGDAGSPGAATGCTSRTSVAGRDRTPVNCSSGQLGLLADSHTLGRDLHTLHVPRESGSLAHIPHNQGRTRWKMI